MIVIVAAILGIATGALTARRRKGSRADIAQYAAVYGIAFALAGFIVTIAIEKLLF